MKRKLGWLAENSGQSMNRKLALKIACISAEDRKWVLERLSSEEIEALTPLLNEIEELGLNRDPAIVKEVIGSLKIESETQKVSNQNELEITNLSNVHESWQKMVLGLVSKQEGERLIVKNDLDIKVADSYKGVPPSLGDSLGKYLSELQNAN